MTTSNSPTSNNVLIALKTLREFIAVQEVRIDELSAQLQQQPSLSTFTDQLQHLQTQIETLDKSPNAEKLSILEESIDTLKKRLEIHAQRVEEINQQVNHSLNKNQENQVVIQHQPVFKNYDNPLQTIQTHLENHDQQLDFLNKTIHENNFSDKIQALDDNYQSRLLNLEQQLNEKNDKFQQLTLQAESQLSTFQQQLDEHLLEISKLDENKWVKLEQDAMMITFVENHSAKNNANSPTDNLAQTTLNQSTKHQKSPKLSIWKKIKTYRPFKRKKAKGEQKKDYLKTPSEFVEEQMIGLYRSLSALLPNKRHWGRSIQFIASRSGEGASVICREFAKVLARRLDMSVLLVDADPQGEQLAHFGIQRSMGWNEAVFENAPIQYALKQIDDSKLFVTQMAMPGESITRIVHAPEIEAILEDLKRQFDFIVIDTLPGTVSVDGLTLSHKVDGVILVVEAECTRWQIVQQTKENIEIRGGKVLGVILNKRRFYIPKFVYDRLL